MVVHKWRPAERGLPPSRTTPRVSSFRLLLAFSLGLALPLGLLTWRWSPRRCSLEHAGVRETPSQMLSPAASSRGFVSREELERIVHKIARNHTIIMLVCNAGYQAFLENWAAFAARAGILNQFLAVAEDEESWAHAEARWPGHVVRLRVPEIEGADGATSEMLGIAGAGATGGRESEFNSPRFKKMMYRRVFYIRELLVARVHVLLCDTDVVLLRDPFPFFPPQYDLMGVRDEPDERGFWRVRAYDLPVNSTRSSLTKAAFCGGFLLLRSTPATWAIVDLLAMKLFRAAKLTGKENEQTFLAHVLYEMLHLEPPPRIGVMPQQLFMPGWLYFKDSKYGWWRQRFVRSTKEPPVMVHNNWVLGKDAKVQRFREKHLWLVPPSTPGAAAAAASPSTSGAA